MGKGAVFLGILGLIVGAGGLGFGVMNWLNQPTVPYEPHCYSYHDLKFTPTPDFIYMPKFLAFKIYIIIRIKNS
ncbi:MAG: hypothetical protein ACFFB8_19550 [Promethearchaeota archaeon]